MRLIADPLSRISHPVRLITGPVRSRTVGGTPVPPAVRAGTTGQLHLTAPRP
jgi:hypothetical protein